MRKSQKSSLIDCLILLKIVAQTSDKPISRNALKQLKPQLEAFYPGAFKKLGFKLRD